MKRFIALTLALLMIIMILPFSAAAADDKTEKKETSGGITIEFAVGDSTLKINGNHVTVETPYVVAGTTLVPLRVITEAFGAKVEWEGTTKTVTITYKDVVIKLSIGNKTVTVNGEKSELLAAPELTNNTTMVPLRFITETFGADVSYDEKTKGITVKKEIIESNSIKDYAMILKRTNKERLGDSYFGWSIGRSADMELDYRSFNGSETDLHFMENALIFMHIYKPDKEDTLDYYYDLLKDYSKDYTVMNLEKGKTPTGVEYASLEYKSKDFYACDRYYIGETYIYDISLETDLADTNKKFTQALTQFNTFDIVFNDKTEDLSDLDKSTNMRIFHSTDMAVQMAIPGQFEDRSNSDTANEFYFFSLNEDNFFLSERIAIDVYSSFEGHTYQDWAQSDQLGNKNSINRDYAVFSDINKMKVDDNNAVYYIDKVNYRSAQTLHKDIFIDAGDYFYNISIQLNNKDGEKAEELMQKIIDSIQIGTIDKDATGKMMRTSDQYAPVYKNYTNVTKTATLSVPDTWEQQDSDDNVLRFSDTDRLIDFYMQADDYTNQNYYALLSISKDFYNLFTGRSYTQIIDSFKGTTVQGNTAYTFSFNKKIEDSENYIRTYVYIVQKGSIIYFYGFSAPELYWGTTNEDILNHIINTAQYK